MKAKRNIAKLGGWIVAMSSYGEVKHKVKGKYSISEKIWSALMKLMDG